MPPIKVVHINFVHRPISVQTKKNSLHFMNKKTAKTIINIRLCSLDSKKFLFFHVIYNRVLERIISIIHDH